MVNAILQVFWNGCFYFFLIMFMVGIFILNLICHLFSPLIQEAYLRKILRWTTDTLLRIYIRSQLISRALRTNRKVLNPFRDRPGGGLIIANHPSMIDAPIILSQIPGLMCVFRAGLKKNLLFGKTATVLGYLSNDDGIAVLREMTARMANGEKFLIFPEGTRTSAKSLNPFNKSYALAAIRAQVPVQLLLIRSSTPILSKKQHFLHPARFPAQFHLEMGPAIEPGRFKTVNQMNAWVEDWYRKQLEGHEQHRFDQHFKVIPPPCREQFPAGLSNKSRQNSASGRYSFKPVIVIPSYNTGGDLLVRTVKAVLACGHPAMVVVDGSTDGSASVLINQIQNPRLTVIQKFFNTGKGDTVRLGATLAQKEGYTHALVMDADGQHPADSVSELMTLAEEHPGAMVLGQPVFGPEAPVARVHGRKLTSFWTNTETLWRGLGDTLFGMRVYPIEPLLSAFKQTSFARGFDFDPEIAVRLAWLGCRPVRSDVPVRYLSREEGGVSHFHYLRDNCKLTFLHFRLVPEFILIRMLPFLRRSRLWKKQA